MTQAGILSKGGNTSRTSCFPPSEPFRSGVLDGYPYVSPPFPAGDPGRHRGDLPKVLPQADL